MFTLFSQGGPLFMGILTLILFSLILVFVRSLLTVKNENQLDQGLKWLQAIGTLGLVVGVLGQLIVLFSAFSIMETSGGVSTEVLAGGLKISLITTVYGLIIYIIHLLFTMILKRFC